MEYDQGRVNFIDTFCEIYLFRILNFRICNADTDDDVGLCTNKNTCENANGVVAGECNVSYTF